MDDDLSAARRMGAVRKLLWPHGKRHKGFMHGKRWAAPALVLLVCALTAVGIAVFNGAGKAPTTEESKGNEGVLALSDFLTTNASRLDFEAAGSLHSLARRLMNEPFEISAKMTVESEALQALGIPLKSLPADLAVKYDLRDAGVKVSAVGISLFEACLTKDELITVSSGAEPMRTELAAADDMSADLTLKNRIDAFIQYPSEAFIDKLLGILAGSVPMDCSERQLGRAFSPKDMQDVNVTLINTELDAEALSKAAAAFSNAMQQDEALYEQAAKLTASAASAAGAKDVTLESLLKQLIDIDYEGTTVAWQVYRRAEVPIGFAIRVVTRDAQVDLYRLAEFDGETSYEHTQLLINGIEVFNADTVTQSDAGEVSVHTIKADGEPISIQGTYELAKIAENTYQIITDVIADGRLLSNDEQTAHIIMDARVEVGSGLGLLGDSRDWTDIQELKEKN